MAENKKKCLLLLKCITEGKYSIINTQEEEIFTEFRFKIYLVSKVSFNFCKLMLKLIEHSFSEILSCYNKNTWRTREKLEIMSKQSHFVLVFPLNFSYLARSPRPRVSITVQNY